MSECKEWLEETRQVFPELKRKKIEADYKLMSHKKLRELKGIMKKSK